MPWLSALVLFQRKSGRTFLLYSTAAFNRATGDGECTAWTPRSFLLVTTRVRWPLLKVAASLSPRGPDCAMGIRLGKRTDSLLLVWSRRARCIPRSKKASEGRGRDKTRTERQGEDLPSV